MSSVDIELWEPEESVGKIWHAFASTLHQPAQHASATVLLDDVRVRIAILFRGLGGAHDVEIRAIPPQTSQHRLSWKRSLGTTEERLPCANFDGEVLRLPESINVFDHADKNSFLYLWLAATAVHSKPPALEADPLRADIRYLQAALTMTRLTLTACPGLRHPYAGMRSETLDGRRDRRLPKVEAAVEAAICHLLGGPHPETEYSRSIAAAVQGQAADLSSFIAPRNYRPHEPVLLWPRTQNLGDRASIQQDDPDPQQAPSPEMAKDAPQRKATRKASDQAARNDSLILHKFESILSWTEFFNLNRRVEDDDEDAAKKAADDLDEISLTRVPQRARTRIKLHLDLAPEDVDMERLAGKKLYPEWDHRQRIYLPDYCRVLTADAEPEVHLPEFLSCPQTQRRIRNVTRQFEALRPKRQHLSRQIDGEDLDIEAAVAARIELMATGEHSDRVYRANRNQERDLAVSILLDTSRSTESVVAGRQVIDIEREALIALAWGLDKCGDDTAIHTFSSLRRDRVFLYNVKRFIEPMSAMVETRIAGLKPGFYTRLGAAIRHASNDLQQQARQRRLLIVITDGKPNDLDHYEGRHGIEDSHMAVREARRSGQSVFGVTIDKKSQATFARIFGSGGFSVISEPEKLIVALPQIYHHLVAG
ncbi:MAG: nitric oxide reductase activation protein NorD [Hyphomicrobiaceae bacterium]